MRDVIRGVLKNAQLLRRDESGAVVAIVALSLIALLGMVVISVDVGGVVVQRRYMVNANDAAALAAAQAFAMNENGADCAGGIWTPAQASADQLADVNASGSTRVSFQPNCADQTVAVQYTKQQQLFFAPVLGFGSTATVAATATAKWGSPGVANPLPIVMYEQAFNNCKLDTDGIPGSRCYVWEDNGNTSGAQSGFGLLDLGNGWNIAANGQCSAPGTSTILSWINGTANVGELPVNYPLPTYVCRVSGMAQVNWDTFRSEDLNKIVYFPLNRCDATLPGNPYGQVDDNGVEVACPTTPDKYDIIGFVAMRLIQVYTPNDAPATTGTCNPGTQVTLPGSTGTLSLDLYGGAGGCFSTPPDQIVSASVTVTKVNAGGSSLKRGPDGTTCASQYDWCYDSVGRQIVWGSGPSDKYTISFDYTNPGICGYPPTNNSAHCLVLDFVKKHLGGGNPGGGFSGSNLAAVSLIK
jgi:Flp pilus assembly protein TadG